MIGALLFTLHDACTATREELAGMPSLTHEGMQHLVTHATAEFDDVVGQHDPVAALFPVSERAVPLARLQLDNRRPIPFHLVERALQARARFHHLPPRAVHRRRGESGRVRWKIIADARGKEHRQGKGTPRKAERT